MRPDWTPETKEQVRKLLTQGWTQRRIAEHFGMPQATLCLQLQRHGLNAPPENLVTVSDAARVMGVSGSNIAAYLRRHKVKVFKWGGQRLIHQDALERLIDCRPELEETAATDAVTITQLAQRWGISLSHASRLLKSNGEPLTYIRGVSGKPVALYDLRTVDHLRPSPLISPPRDALDSTQLAARLRLCRSSVNTLRRAGMPTLPQQGRGGHYYYRLLPVAQWLAAQAKPSLRRRGERLLRELAPQEAA